MNALAKTAANDDTALTTPIHVMLLQAARDPAFDVAKFETLVRLQREFELADRTEQQRLEFAAAMGLVQAEILAIVRDAKNDQIGNKFASLEAVDAAIRPIYTRHGFTVEFNTEQTERGEIKVICEVSHRAGFVKTRELEAGADTTGPNGKPNKTPLHGLASTVNYLRRQLLGMAFNLAFKNEDNDGNRRRPANDESGELIPGAAIALLHELIAETKTDEQRLLAHLGFPDLTTIKDVPARDFAKLKNALLDKKNRQAQRAANSQTKTGAAA